MSGTSVSNKLLAFFLLLKVEEYTKKTVIRPFKYALATA